MTMIQIIPINNQYHYQYFTIVAENHNTLKDTTHYTDTQNQHEVTEITEN